MFKDTGDYSGQKQNMHIVNYYLWELPMTTGAKDSHRDNGIWWPKTNWEAAALKKGSRAEGIITIESYETGNEC